MGQKGWTPEGRRAGQRRLGGVRGCAHKQEVRLETIGEGLQESRVEVDMLIRTSSGVCVFRWSRRGQGYEGKHTYCCINISPVRCALVPEPVRTSSSILVYLSLLHFC